jgi:hypothetical protein
VLEQEQEQEREQEQELERVPEQEQGQVLRLLYLLVTKNRYMVADKPILSFQSCSPKCSQQPKTKLLRENQVHSTIVGSKIAVSLVWY